MKDKEEIELNVQKLESIFFSILDGLRGVWFVENAANVLFSLVFYKRIFALVREGAIDFIKITHDDLVWINSTRQQLLTDKQNAVETLSRILVKISKQNQYLQNIFAPLVFSLEREGEKQHLVQMILLLEEIDFSSKALPVKVFGGFFNESLRRVAFRLGTHGEKRSSPQNLNQLLLKLANPKDNERVFDPTAGQGGTVISFLEYCKTLDVYLQESNINTWALCKMNLMMNGHYNTSILHCNSLTEYKGDSPRVDIAIAHFDFGGYLNTEKILKQGYIKIPFDTNRSRLLSNSLFVQLMLDRLNDRGRMFVVLPIHVLYKERENRKLREYLLRRDLLEAVITLPYGMLYSTGEAISILAINKNKVKQRKGKVLFINASSLGEEDGNWEHRQLSELDIDLIVDNYRSYQDANLNDLSNYVELVDSSKIILNAYNLNAKRYAAPFIKELKRINKQNLLYPLKNIFIKELPAVWLDNKDNLHKELPYLGINGIGTSISNYLLNMDKLPSTEGMENIEGRLVNESVLIVPRYGDHWGVSYFNYQGQSILVGKELLLFRVDEQKILIEYLILQLYSELFQQQLEIYKSDHIEGRISPNSFAQISIILPGIEEQTRITKQQKIELLREEEAKVEQLRERLNLNKQRAYNDQYKIISSLQHELGNRLPAILTEFKNLKDFLLDKVEYGESITMDEPIFELFEGEDRNDVDSLSEVLERIESTLRYSIMSIDSTGNIVKANQNHFKLEYHNLKSLLEEVKGMYSMERNFEIAIEVQEDAYGREIKVGTYIDKSQLITALTNLIENAKRHGFEGDKKYQICFRLGISRNQKEVIIIYKNDGKAFPDTFSFEDFISFGNYAGGTGHSGIGGYLIHRILENHNGSIAFKRNRDYRDPFKVQFEMTLPLLPKRDYKS